MSVAEMKGLVKRTAAGLVYLYRQASVEPDISRSGLCHKVLGSLEIQWSHFDPGCNNAVSMQCSKEAE